ncbi:MAG: GAF domain-containing protein, partial [Chloroflexota bacterium]
PLSGGPDGIVYHPYIAFRGYLQRMLSPLAYLIAGSALLIVVGLPVFLHFNLVRPLEALLKGVRQVDAGDLKVEMPVEFNDEIGSLTQSVNSMVAALRGLVSGMEALVAERTEELAAANTRLRAEIVERSQTEEALQHARDDLSALYEVSAVAGRALTLESMLSESLARAMAAIPGDMGAVFLLDETAGESGSPAWRLAAHQGIPADGVERMRTLPANRGLIDWILEHREPILIPDAAADPRIPDAMRHAGPRSLLAAPLEADGQVLGVFGLGRPAGLSFDAEEIALLASIADHMGVAVQSHRLREMAGRTKMLEDRQALARDMHDSVTQMLYALTAFTEAGQTQLESGAVEAVGPTLTRIGDTARQALKEMRLFIHQLRPSVLGAEGLVAALHMRLAAVEGRSGMRTHLLADENLRLPPVVENELHQIALEALNNVLRHAQASTVTVTLRRDDERIDLEIADDGGGFDPGAVRSGGMGLINMRERAESLGGVFVISSSPGSETRVKVELPNQS